METLSNIERSFMQKVFMVYEHSILWWLTFQSQATSTVFNILLQCTSDLKVTVTSCPQYSLGSGVKLWEPGYVNIHGAMKVDYI